MSTLDTALPVDPSLDALEARSEHLRSGLADTVGELRNRLSPDTIKADLKSVFAKLDVADRTAAVVIAARRGYIGLETGGG